MIDTTQIGNHTLAAMEQVKEEFPVGKIRSVALVIEVDDGEKPTKWRVFANDDRRWVARVVLEMGLGALDEEGGLLLLDED